MLGPNKPGMPADARQRVNEGFVATTSIACGDVGVDMIGYENMARDLVHGQT